MLEFHFTNFMLAAKLTIPVAEAQYDRDSLIWESIQCSNEEEIRSNLNEILEGCCVQVANKYQKFLIAKGLFTCEAHIKARRLTAGSSSYARECYQSILPEFPNNVDAPKGLAESKILSQFEFEKR